MASQCLGAYGPRTPLLKNLPPFVELRHNPDTVLREVHKTNLPEPTVGRPPIVSKMRSKSVISNIISQQLFKKAQSKVKKSIPSMEMLVSWIN